MSKKTQNPRLANGGSGNLDNSGGTIETLYSRLIREYQARDYSVGLTSGESGGEDEAKERTSQRFLLLRVMLADKEISKAELKVGTYLLMIKYNDHTGLCNPGNDAIAEATALDLRTVARAKLALKLAMYLIYESTKGGYKSDTTNNYEFRFPSLACRPGVNPVPKSTPGESKIEEPSKRTSEEAREESKPKDPPKLENVNGAIAYVSVADHEQHLDALANYDFMVGRVRERHPDVKTVKLYVRRLNGELAS